MSVCTAAVRRLLKIDPNHVFMTGRWMENYGIYELLLQISYHVLQCDTTKVTNMGPTNECERKQKQKKGGKNHCQCNYVIVSLISVNCALSDREVTTPFPFDKVSLCLFNIDHPRACFCGYI